MKNASERSDGHSQWKFLTQVSTRYIAQYINACIAINKGYAANTTPFDVVWFEGMEATGRAL